MLSIRSLACTLVLGTGSLLLALTAIWQPTCADTTTGWNELWNNNAPAAHRSFTAALEGDKNDLRARRGIVLANMALGRERDAFDHLEKLVDTPGAGFRDFLLIEYYYTFSATCGDDEKRFMEMCKKLYEQDGISALDRRPIVAAMSTYALRAADSHKAKQAMRELNRVDKWSVLGPFSNLSGGGHTKDFLDFDTFKPIGKGKGGIDATWHNLEVVDLLAAVNFGNHFERSEHATMYAGFELSTDEPRELLVSITRNGSLVAYIDEQVVHESDAVASRVEVEHLRVSFNAGYHSLIFKISSREDSPTLAVSVSNLDGSHPGGIKTDYLIPSIEQVSGAPAELITLPSAVELGLYSNVPVSDPEQAFWLMLALWQFDMQEEARVRGNELSEPFAGCAFVQHAAAIGALIDGDLDTWRERMNLMYDTDPSNALALIHHARMEMRDNRYTQSDSLLTHNIRTRPQNVSAMRLLLQSYWDRQLIDKAVSLAERMITEHPDFADPYSVLSKHAEALGDKGKARKYQQKEFGRRAKSASYLVRWSEAWDREDYGRMAKQLEELRKLYPDSPRVLTMLANTKLGDGKVDDALELTDEACENFPNIFATQIFKAAIEELQIPYGSQHKSEAITYYRKAQRLNPGDFDTRDKLRSLLGKQPVGEILPPIDLENVRENRVKANQYPGEGACVLHEERRRIRFQDGSSHLEYALVIQILTDEGVKDFGSLSTGLNPLFTNYTMGSARTIKPSGQIFEAEWAFDEVAFPNLAPGDLIELHYGANTWQEGPLSREFWDTHGFQWSVPTLVSRYVLLIPTGEDISWELHNVAADKMDLLTVIKHASFDQYSWEMRDIGPIPDEPLLPAWRDLVPWLDVSTVDGWDIISSWYQELSVAAAAPDPVVAARALEVVGDAETREDRIRRLYNYVANEIAYENLLFQYSAFVPERARSVLRSKYGDCKDKVCLLKSMLEAVGVTSYFALVSPVDDGTTTYLPSPRFNHTILAIQESEDSSYQFLDPTAKGLPASSLPGSLVNSRALVVRPGSSQLSVVRSPVALQGASSGDSVGITSLIRTAVDVVDDHDLRVDRHRAYFDGDEIAALRDLLAGETNDSRILRLERTLSARHLDVKVESCHWQNIDTTTDSLVVDYTFRVKQGVAEQGAILILKLPWDTVLDTRFGAIVSNDSRTAPMSTYGLETQEDELLVFDIPPGWKLAAVPDSRHFESSFGGFTYSYEVVGTQLLAHRYFSVARQLVQPDKYSDFRQLIQGTAKENGTVFVFQK